ncbi:MAG TPA: hypothetical protein VF828_04585 [Patescibacteria group bacterium]
MAIDFGSDLDQVTSSRPAVLVNNENRVSSIITKGKEQGIQGVREAVAQLQSQGIPLGMAERENWATMARVTEDRDLVIQSFKVDRESGAINGGPTESGMPVSYDGSSLQQLIEDTRRQNEGHPEDSEGRIRLGALNDLRDNMVFAWNEEGTAYIGEAIVQRATIRNHEAWERALQTILESNDEQKGYHVQLWTNAAKFYWPKEDVVTTLGKFGITAAEK